VRETPQREEDDKMIFGWIAQAAARCLNPARPASEGQDGRAAASVRVELSNNMQVTVSGLGRNRQVTVKAIESNPRKETGAPPAKRAPARNAQAALTPPPASAPPEYIPPVGADRPRERKSTESIFYAGEFYEVSLAEYREFNDYLAQLETAKGVQELDRFEVMERAVYDFLHQKGYDAPAPAASCSAIPF
jgi:hypothetical protein